MKIETSYFDIMPVHLHFTTKSALWRFGTVLVAGLLRACQGIFNSMAQKSVLCSLRWKAAIVISTIVSLSCVRPTKNPVVFQYFSWLTSNRGTKSKWKTREEKYGCQKWYTMRNIMFQRASNKTKTQFIPHNSNGRSMNSNSGSSSSQTISAWSRWFMLV